MDLLRNLRFSRFLLGFALALVMILLAEMAAQGLEADLVPDGRVVASGGADDAHPFLLWEDAPGPQGEGGAAVHINNLGLRGPPVLRPKPARERRLMVLGDDTVFGVGVQFHETLGHVAVDELGGERVGLSALNGGIRNYSTLQLLNMMELRGWDLEPDVIVLVDVAADRKVERFQDEEVIPPVRLADPIARRLERWALFRILDYRLGVLRGPEYTQHLAVLQGGMSGNAEGLARLGLDAKARALRRLVTRAQDHGVGVVFLVTPEPTDLAGDPTPEVKLHRRVIRDAAEWCGAKVVEGGEAFALSGRPADELWDDAHHLTALGHRVLGRALARVLGRWIRGGEPGGAARGGALPIYEGSAQEAQ